MKSMNDETEARVAAMAGAHWSYVESVLKVHDVIDSEIKACGHHYLTAFVHGYKHALEDIAAEAEQKGWGSK